MNIVRYTSISTLPLQSGESRLDQSSNLANKRYSDAPYIVDDSGFVPMSEAVKRVTGGALSKEQIKTMYDFPDGTVPSGFRVPLDRRRGFTGDIAEVSQAVRESGKEANEALSKLYDRYQDEQALDRLNSQVSEPSQPSKE